MNANRKLFSTLVMLLVVTLAMTPLVSAKDSGKVKLKRDAREAAGAPSTSFGDTGDALACSGSCDCSSCNCYGTLSCCIGGCEACWEFRDDMGYCNAAN